MLDFYLIFVSFMSDFCRFMSEKAVAQKTEKIRVTIKKTD